MFYAYYRLKEHYSGCYLCDENYYDYYRFVRDEETYEMPLCRKHGESMVKHFNDVGSSDPDFAC